MSRFRFAWLCALFSGIASTVALPSAEAQNSSLSGYVYVDRNNDGVLRFNNEPQPELIIPGVTIQLYSAANGPLPLATLLTDSQGRFSFTGLAAGTYSLAQVQPVEFVNGLSSTGTIRTLLGMLNPPGTSVGVATSNLINTIVLTAGTAGDLFNFGELGLLPAYASKRDLLGSAPPPSYADPPDEVPEPASVALLGCVLPAAALAYRRARRYAATS